MISEKEQGELLHLVADLTELYTSKESTSIPYEKARMLMDAVLYCIAETKENNGTTNILVPGEKANLRERYEKGYARVIHKVKQANEFYNRLIVHFSSYGNECYYDTIVKGMPPFFMRYDARFCPQEHLLTLDYPVLRDLEEKCGINRIEQYLLCVAIEQRFLYPIGETSIKGLFDCYPYEFSEAIENVCRPVLRYKIVLALLERESEDLMLKEDGIQQIKIFAQEKTAGQLLTLFEQTLYRLIEQEYQGQEELYQYLSLDIQDFVVELKNAAKYNNLHALFPV